jgi:hydroxymethylbilane synthase
MTAPFRLGTRGSPLALAQARLTAAALTAAHDIVVEIVPIVTTGDRIQDRPLADIGGKALWTKELDAALLEGRIDAAVHSMKDVETRLADGIVIAAMLPRADVRDRLLGAASIDALRYGARVGTSSPRREAQLLHLRPDLMIVPLRGNVATRMAKLAAGEADATLLAAAGLERLGLSDGVAIPLATLLPAPAQGAIGLTARAEDSATLAQLAAIDHAPTSVAVGLERAFLSALVADCHSSVAALASFFETAGEAGGNTGGIEFRAEILLPDGSERRSVRLRLDVETGPALAATEQQHHQAAVAQAAASLLAAASPRLAALFGSGAPVATEPGYGAG